MFDLAGKVALVTGGNRGIGLGMAEALARAGADIVIWGSQAARNDAARDRLAALPVRVLAQTVDVSDEAAVIAAMDAAVAEMGRIDTVVANAGIGGTRQRFTDLTTTNVDHVFGVNVRGVYWTLREACKHIVARSEAGEPGASLVAVSSLGALHGMPQAEAYAMSKGALTALMRSLAVEFGRHAIRANTIAPGWIETELTPGLNDEVPRTRILPRVPLRRWGRPEDFGGIAVYLASDASAYHSGDVFVIDGGYSVF